MRKSLIPWVLIFLSFNAIAGQSQEKPKYGPEATPLSVSHDYFLKSAAPGFWSLIPYYVPQRAGSTCSVASTAILVNAARAGMKLKADNKLVTEDDLLKKVNQGTWKKWKPFHATSLDELKPLVEASLKAYGVNPLQVEAVHVENTELAKKNLHEVLAQAENSNQVYILANFLQSVYTGDADIGHVAPLGAYDSVRKRVLVLDPDRDWYEPYWVSEDTLLKGMATPDHQSGRSRGYLVVRLPERR